MAPTRVPTKVKVIFGAAVSAILFWTYHLYVIKSMTSRRADLLGPDVGHVFSGEPRGAGPRGAGRELQQAGEPLMTSWGELASRKRRARKVCESRDVPGRVHGVYTHKAGVIYCFVPKAGCTFWKRVFKAVNLSKEDPFAISRNLVHTVGGSGVPYTSEHSQLRYPTRFIVTRDPFSRLLSSYLDKFYLPDFWLAEAISMIRNRTGHQANCHTDFMRGHFDNMAKIFQSSPNGTWGERRCGKFLTFYEFLRDGLNRSEPHWMPVHEICNPCLFNVTHVAHMETFNQDARVILGKMGMGHILDNIDRTAQVDEEIKTIIDYNFNYTHAKLQLTFFNSCISDRELAYRLWYNFRWRGYIDPDVNFVVPPPGTTGQIKADLLTQIWRARESGLKNPQRLEEAKKDFQMKIFQTIPKALFEKITEKYKLDFLLFGYEDQRDALYRSLYQVIS
ncbi:carbohydrate sulfotransferase 11-like [Physella acuta]|uniref:carbohydrate sulfotransferase 11-like n=1 Tax=Physella acuta TaxID=109671 RepID=UPI0027DAE541|nr:carbohydrate sulfotransferase 11-like [Physella acuta]